MKNYKNYILEKFSIEKDDERVEISYYIKNNKVGYIILVDVFGGYD